MEIMLNEYQKLVTSKKKWKNKQRLEVCIFKKVSNKWVPSDRFINIEYKNKTNLITAINNPDEVE